MTSFAQNFVLVRQRPDEHIETLELTRRPTATTTRDRRGVGVLR